MSQADQSEMEQITQFYTEKLSQYQNKVQLNFKNRWPIKNYFQLNPILARVLLKTI